MQQKWGKAVSAMYQDDIQLILNTTHSSSTAGHLPDGPPGILIQKVNPSLSLTKVLPCSLDLELHEALPPVINLASAGSKHANGDLRSIAPLVTCPSQADTSQGRLYHQIAGQIWWHQLHRL